MLFYSILAVVLVLIDQLTKILTRTYIDLGESFTFIPGLLDLTYIKNTGAAFSILEKHTWLLTVLSAVIVLVVAYLVVKKFFTGWVGMLSATLILAGGVGNLIDRATVGYVVDMFHFEFWPSYPVFNVADMCVVCGAILGSVYYLWLYEKYDMKPKKGETDGNSDAPTE